jgi:hypothetical protein
MTKSFSKQLPINLITNIISFLLSVVISIRNIALFDCLVAPIHPYRVYGFCIKSNNCIRQGFIHA